ncbi:cation:proton antiporter [Corynebacterium glyciniphilum]|uniref:cation:proton antiporter n=1 Tax=Corynebacterium glyciniphilum TaxID=1404244 RepID=UPI00264E4CB6|nr:cation:proton antiporter [Corynebacterium glyciniphilum]MDN5684710.1 cation:proton antiporter [Corynebacterium glyciniphilum]
MTDALVSFAWIAGAGLLAPVLAFLTGKRIPAVVFLLVLGLFIGPFGFGLASDGEAVDLMRELGLGLLFLLAGMEINPSMLKSRQGGHALATWVLCLVLSFAGAMLLTSGDAGVSVVLGIALTSTALGTLMPILKQNELSGTPVGNSVMIHGAIGELAPVTAMAVLLSARSTWASAAVLAAFFVVAIIVALVPRTVRTLTPWIGWAIRDGVGSTNQTVIRSVVLMLAVLMAVAAVFDLDVVLGAFATGIILHQIVPDAYRPGLEKQVEAVGYGVFIPVFFVTSGMAIDTGVIAERPWFVLAIVPIILITRGLPIFLRELWSDTGSELQGWREKLEMSLYSATGLPIIVAVTGVATASGIIGQEEASLLVAGGALTVLIFPLVAPAVGTARKTTTASSPPSV